MPYAHDAHGNMTAMPHLPLMRFDHHDRLRATAAHVVPGGVPPTHYGYDLDGDRIRKVTDAEVTAVQLAAGRRPVRRAERIYLGDLEIYREYAADGVTVTLERVTKARRATAGRRNDCRRDCPSTS
jgi:hypothetical protein